jgi:hypothetical protein
LRYLKIEKKKPCLFSSSFFIEANEKCKLASDGGRPLRVSRPISLHLDQGGQSAKSAAGRGEYVLPLPAIKSHFENGLRKICGVL